MTSDKGDPPPQSPPENVSSFPGRSEEEDGETWIDEELAATNYADTVYKFSDLAKRLSIPQRALLLLIGELIAQSNEEKKKDGPKEYEKRKNDDE